MLSPVSRSDPATQQVVFFHKSLPFGYGDDQPTHNLGSFLLLLLLLFRAIHPFPICLTMNALESQGKKPRLDASSDNGDVTPASTDADHRGYRTDVCEFPTSIMNGSGPVISVGTQSKTTPCLKFFSTSGCPFGERCHFSHYVPGGLSSLSLTGYGAMGAAKLSGMLGVARFSSPLLLCPDSTPKLGGYKTRMCNKYDTFEGCRFGNKCHFAHGDEELLKPNGGFPFSELDKLASADYAKNSTLSDSQSMGGLSHREPTPPGMVPAVSLVDASTAKISINASLAGAVIGRGGIKAKQICNLSGAKLLIREHENDANLRYVVLEGSFEQINLASQMVREVLLHKDTLPPKPTGFGAHNYKTRMCENFAKGNCTFGDRCHFAHDGAELREPPVPV